MNSEAPTRSIQIHPSKRSHRLGRHPWILATSIVEPNPAFPVGEVVDLRGTDGKFLGRGLYNPSSRIRIRMYTWDPNESLDARWFQHRLESAWVLRDAMPRAAHTKSVRLVFSEADGLSGLVVDRFEDHIVMHVNAAVMLPWVDTMTHVLVERYQPSSVVLHVDERTARSEGIEAQSRTLYGMLPEEPILIRENDLMWEVDLREGQKTGYYLDQRDNRLRAAQWVPAGARVLDVCTYAGGFALTIAKHSQAAEITAIDSSAKALAWAQANAERNGLAGRVHWEQNDFFESLSQRLEKNEQYDMIVLDPPRLAGARDQIQRALAAYHRLNYLALRLLKPGGILVTCSCSGRVTRSDFLDMLHGVAVRARRDLQILENRGAAPDHPVSIHCPETDYLKCIIARAL